MRKLEDSDKKLFGDYALLVVGFEHYEHESIFLTSKEHSESLKVIFAKKDDSDSTLSELFLKKDKYGFQEHPYNKRAIIMSGFSEKEVAEFMKKIYSLRLPPNMWAVLTKTSNNWKLFELLEELEKESEAMEKPRR